MHMYIFSIYHSFDNVHLSVSIAVPDNFVELQFLRPILIQISSKRLSGDNMYKVRSRRSRPGLLRMNKLK